MKQVEYNGKLTDVWIGTNGEVIGAKVYNSGSGYLTVPICSGTTSTGKPTTIRKYLHRLVAELYLPNPENLPQVNHIDGNKGNNSLQNLEWVSRSENIRHSHSLGLNEKRKKVKAVELTVEQVKECYTRVKAGERIGAVAESLGKPRTTISSIINKRSRRDITDLLD